MPKQSEKKRMELENLQAKLKTNPRETKPVENYLNHVKEFNKRNVNVDSRQHKKGLSQVSSLPNLHPRNINSEQKVLKSPATGSKPDSSRVFQRGRQSQPFKQANKEHFLPNSANQTGNKLSGFEDQNSYIDWQKNKI